ncbi:hypothetical protein JW979_11645 [bacterium]|nr:hypothetical protein [candidate division CSSED10-310 bacterium]
MKASKYRIGILHAVIIISVLVTWGCGQKDDSDQNAKQHAVLPGGISGSEINGNVTVQVIDAMSALPLEKASVFLQSINPETFILESETNAQGFAIFRDERLTRPVCITVSCCSDEAYDTFSFFDVSTDMVVVPIILRKSPSVTRTEIFLDNINDTGNTITFYINQPYNEKITPVSSASKFALNRYRMRLPATPLSLAAVMTTSDGIPTHWMVNSFYKSPPSSTTPLTMSMRSIDKSDTKVSTGKLSCEPANLLSHNSPWDPLMNYSIDVFMEKGLAGLCRCGISHIYSDLRFETEAWKPPDNENITLRLTAVSSDSDQAAFTMAYLRYPHDQLPKDVVFKLKNIPTSLNVKPATTTQNPVLYWKSDSVSLQCITIQNRHFDYDWHIFLPGDKRNFVMPSVPLGNAGFLIPGESYTAAVEAYTIPDFDYRNFSLNALQQNITHWTRSESCILIIPEIPGIERADVTESTDISVFPE